MLVSGKRRNGSNRYDHSKPWTDLWIGCAASGMNIKKWHGCRANTLAPGVGAVHREPTTVQQQPPAPRPVQKARSEDFAEDSPILQLPNVLSQKTERRTTGAACRYRGLQQGPEQSQKQQSTGDAFRTCRDRFRLSHKGIIKTGRDPENQIPNVRTVGARLDSSFNSIVYHEVYPMLSKGATWER